MNRTSPNVVMGFSIALSGFATFFATLILLGPGTPQTGSAVPFEPVPIPGEIEAPADPRQSLDRPENKPVRGSFCPARIADVGERPEC